MDEDGKEKSTQKKNKLPTKQYKFSHFFKSMTVDFDRAKAKDVMDQSVEWKKPVVAPNAPNLPNAADFDQLEFKRGGDENMNITINLVRDEIPERFKLSPALADILDTDEATRADAMMGIWDYIKAMGLQDEDEKRAFECDDRLKIVSNFLLREIILLTTTASSSRERLHTKLARDHRPSSSSVTSHQVTLYDSSRQGIPRESSANNLRHQSPSR